MVKKSLLGIVAAVALGLLVPAFGAEVGNAPTGAESSSSGQQAKDSKGAEAKSAADEAKKTAKANRMERRQNRATAKSKIHQ